MPYAEKGKHDIYLHYTLDLWFYMVLRKACRGQACLVRYCDDFVCCFQYQEDAKTFYQSLIPRLAKFNLDIAEEKTIFRVIVIYSDTKNYGIISRKRLLFAEGYC